MTSEGDRKEERRRRTGLARVGREVTGLTSGERAGEPSATGCGEMEQAGEVQNSCQRGTYPRLALLPSTAASRGTKETDRFAFHLFESREKAECRTEGRDPEVMGGASKLRSRLGNASSSPSLLPSLCSLQSRTCATMTPRCHNIYRQSAPAWPRRHESGSPLSSARVVATPRRYAKIWPGLHESQHLTLIHSFPPDLSPSCRGSKGGDSTLREARPIFARFLLRDRSSAASLRS